MADTRLLPAGINDERSRVMLSLIERLGELDLSKLLIYRLKDIPDGLLLNLAWQFHVMGDEGWNLVSPEQQLDLVKRAIELHRYRGTRYSILQALASIGYDGTRIKEPADLRDDFIRDSSWFLDGSILLDGSHNLDADFEAFAELVDRYWNEYHVELDIEPTTALDVATQERILRLIALNAPLRCRLLYVLFEMHLQWPSAITAEDLESDPPAEIAFGTGTTPETIGDTALQAEYFRQAIEFFSLGETLIVRGTLAGDEADPETSEVGVFTESGDLIGRRTFVPKTLAAKSRVRFNFEFAF